MSSPCNSLNVQQIKVSNLVRYTSVKPNDLVLVIESGSLGTYYSRKSYVSDLLASSHTGSFTGSFVGVSKTTGSFTGSLKGKHLGSAILTGSFSGSSKGYFVGKSKTTGSFSGSVKGFLTGKSYGQFSGSASGSFRGVFSASKQFNQVSFYGTASWAKGNPIGTGAQNAVTYWKNTNELTSNQYLTYDLLTNNFAGIAAGRINTNRPLFFFNNIVGEQLLQFSSSGEVYSQGMQGGSSYLRTGKNFVIFYSGSYYNAGAQNTKDARWYAAPPVNVGKTGWTVFGTRQRLVGVGHFSRSEQIGAQLHVHLSGSTGWPYQTFLPNTGSFNPNQYALLVTSGSGYKKLMAVSGSGHVTATGFSGSYENTSQRLYVSVPSQTLNLDFNKYNVIDAYVDDVTPTLNIVLDKNKVCYLSVYNHANTTVSWSTSSGTLIWPGGSAIGNPTNGARDLFLIVSLAGSTTKMIMRVGTNMS